ncbi:LemA family protein [Mammaliicoccus sp. Dog046]|uniref:LemA family protein n=1 Tax=Mammaliicoccus sp. Dog046 TaxID=3034233 RepID=UPI002B261250|nr:LemA family protein [Mammaliicoccus sp. Dog046]WQK86427.1 LemA family protein [Mammaliicoccus sp. Dog046]
MKKYLGPIIAVVAVIAVIGLLMIGPYNRLVGLEEKSDESLSNIDNQLQRRVDLIPNLVDTVKGYTKHEEKVFKDVADARSKLSGAQTPQDKAEANGEVNSALSRLLAISEKYPDLKADKQFTGLRDELAGTENRIAVARKDYNESINEYNQSTRRFPSSIVAGLFNFDKKEYFQAKDGAKDAPKVDFGGDES